MHHHEKLAFLKFFITYFVSVATLILLAGYLYFSQIKAHYLKSEEFSLIEYARRIKMGGSLKKYDNGYRSDFVEFQNKHIDIRNFTISEREFSKYVPMNRNMRYLVVYKTKSHFETVLFELKKLVIFVQVLLLLLFALISYKLAKNALKPLQESISKLDKFAKDLIHDLNTPVTSIKLNMKLIEKIPDLQEYKALKRLKKSVHDISELHENLTLLLQEETFQMEFLNICEVVSDVMQTQEQIYPNLSFEMNCASLKVKVNKNAMRQILQNIISNACKYNAEYGYVKAYIQNDVLYIEDNGKGIEEPSKIFNRSYSAQNSSGIGLDIVKRLAVAMDISIEVKTSPTGSIFILKF